MLIWNRSPLQGSVYSIHLLTPKFHLGLEQNAPSALFIELQLFSIFKVLKARLVKAQNSILVAMICKAQNEMLGIRPNR